MGKKKEIKKTAHIIKLEADSEIILIKLSEATEIEDAEQLQRDYNNITFQIEAETNYHNRDYKKNKDTVSLPNLRSQKQRMRN